MTSILLSACGVKSADTEPAAVAPPAAASEGDAAPAVASEGEAAPAARGVDHIALGTTAGEVVITPIYHASAMVQVGDTTIWLDPWSKGALDDRPKADVLLITDVHFDHLDKDAISKVARDDTIVVAPQAVADQIGRPVQHVLATGQSAEVAGVTVTAVPMYNTTRGPDEGGVFHEKGRGNGYILAIGGKRIYFAGDTECTDEMRALTDIDIAFMPMNLPYTMPPDEAAACVEAFHPALAVPYHYAGSDLSVFTAALQDKVPVTLAEFYPGGMPW